LVLQDGRTGWRIDHQCHPRHCTFKSEEEQHAFIQIIDCTTAQTSYYSFPIEDFAFSRSAFAIRIGENFFSKSQLHYSDKSNITGLEMVADFWNLAGELK